MTRFAIGVVAGALLLGGARFVAAPWPEPVHYHANWAVVIDGEPLDLSSDVYMEEVESCAAGDEILPTQRVHMHNNEDHVVHVHHEGVTWGHFLENLGFVMGEDFLVVPWGPSAGEYREGEERSLVFIVNGFQVDDVTHRVIESGDRLLISLGPEDPPEVRESQFSLVADDALEYNERMDPAGCAGAVEPTTFERLRRAFWG